MKLTLEQKIGIALLVWAVAMACLGGVLIKGLLS